jgi:hypothetical protein
MGAEQFAYFAVKRLKNLCVSLCLLCVSLCNKWLVTQRNTE